METPGVPLVQFQPTVRFRHDELLTMSRALEHLVQWADAWPRRACHLVAQARYFLLDSLGPPARPARRTSAPLPARPGATVGADAGCDLFVDVASERLLDVAAYLLDAAELVHGAGAIVDAFALEGIEGRLLEAAVGAGRIE